MFQWLDAEIKGKLECGFIFTEGFSLGDKQFPTVYKSGQDKNDVI